MSDDPLTSIQVAIMLGKSKEEYGELTPELNEYWDRLVIEIKEIQDKGGIVALTSELD